MKSFPPAWLNYSLDKIAFESKVEETAFETELSALYLNEQTRTFVRKNTINALYDLYLVLSSDRSTIQSALLASLIEDQEAKLCILPFLESIIPSQETIEYKPSALEVFIHLASRGVTKETLVDLIESDLLSIYQMNRLTRLKDLYLPNIETLVEFHLQYQNRLDQALKNIGSDMLLLMYPTMIDEDTPTRIYNYLTTILPRFVEVFESEMEQATLYNATSQMVEWMLVYKRHLLKQEEAIESNDPYYEMEFSTIVKYIPKFIWWNNGLGYRNGDKKFYFGSAGFCALGKGESIRKATDFHHFTRRMANRFVNLPYDFDQQGKDMYIYLYTDSLGAGPHLSNALQTFIRHPAGKEALEEELDRWNPVIQKLSTAEFETLEPPIARQLLGYIYHCLRDQPGFTVQRRSIQQLLNDSVAYHHRINERIQIRMRRERLAAERKAPTEKATRSWKPCRSLQSFENARYTIIELTTEPALQHEGSVMKHCVGGYMNRCKNGSSSIWSLREKRDKKWYSCVTMEIVKEKHIIQMSAPFNAVPSKTHREIILKWQKREGIEVD